MFTLFVALIAAGADDPQRAPAQTVVVTGKRLEDAQAKLDACLASQCRPDQDIDATLALAETQLMDGKYREARTTLLKALKRNRHAAASYPVPVSDLQRANSKVSASLGFDRDYYRSTWAIYKTLRDGLPPADTRKYSALMEVAEMTYRTRGHTRARLYYEKIARQARKEGRRDIAALAELRSAIRHLPPESSMQRRRIERIAGLSDPELRAPALEAKLALARLALQKGDETTAQRFIAEVASMGVKRPMLIYSPPYSMVQRELQTSSDMGVALAPPPPTGGEPGGVTGSGGPSITKVLPTGLFSTLNRLPDNVDDMWVDVSFRITPDGRVADAQVQRSRGNISWAAPLLESIKRRRYTAGSLNEPGSRRLERYTYTAGYDRSTTTRSAVRSPEARVEYLDLSDLAGSD